MKRFHFKLDLSLFNLPPLDPDRASFYIWFIVFSL